MCCRTTAYLRPWLSAFPAQHGMGAYGRAAGATLVGLFSRLLGESQLNYMPRGGWRHHAFCGASSTFHHHTTLAAHAVVQSNCLGAMEQPAHAVYYETCLPWPTCCLCRQALAADAACQSLHNRTIAKPNCTLKEECLLLLLLSVSPGLNPCCCGGDIARPVPGHACEGDDAAAAAAGLPEDTDDEGSVQKTATPEPTQAGGESLPRVLGCWNKLCCVSFCHAHSPPFVCLVVTHTYISSSWCW
jgi:hypothetical protein